MSGRYDHNGRSTGILSDGTRVNVYRYQGAGDEWTAALHYPDGGYSALVLSGRSAEFDEHNLEGPHMGSFIPWDAVPGNIKRDIEHRAVGSSMVANGHSYERNPMLKESDKRVVRAFVNEKPDSSNLLDTDGVRLDKMGLGGETVAKWINGRIAIVSTESVKSDESIIRAIIKVAGPGVVDYSYARKGHRVHEHGAMGRNGRGIYHETAVGKNDMVLVPDHRGRWRIDLVTSAGGNHIDVTQHQAGTAGNSGYSSPELAFRSALDIQRARGIRGKSHVWIADRDGGLTDYEPMERNGNPGDPRPKFALGDRVCSTIAPNRGEVSYIGGYDPDLGYQYKVLEAGGRRQWWPEVNMVLDEQTPNGRATTVDPVAARELDLYIANTYELVGAKDSIGKSIDANLKRKVASGKYDSALAPKAWQHLVDEGAKRYQKEFGSGSPIFNAATRRQVAEDFARAWESDSGMQPNASKKTIRFVRAGQVERWQPSRKGYVWHEGYSEDGNTQPYLTRREAQESAKSRGARAVFEG